MGPSKQALERTRAKKQANYKRNCLQDMLLELMDERNVEPVDIHMHTGIPWTTLMEWVYGSVKCQMLDGKILDLARFFNVSIQYLAFGIGDDDPVFGDDNPSLRVKAKKLSTLEGKKRSARGRKDFS